MRWFWLAVLLPSLGAAETFQAEVVSISDGDTFWVLTEEKQRIHIRMAVLVGSGALWLISCTRYLRIGCGKSGSMLLRHTAFKRI